MTRKHNILQQTIRYTNYFTEACLKEVSSAISAARSAIGFYSKRRLHIHLAGSIDKSLGKLQIFVDVLEIGNQTDRSTQGTSRFAVNAKQELLVGQGFIITTTAIQPLPLLGN